mgnify:CR=1 FL=1
MTPPLRFLCRRRVVRTELSGSDAERMLGIEKALKRLHGDGGAG